ncbi:MAG: M28 family peptidase [Planctomycetota bacterium]
MMHRLVLPALAIAVSLPAQAAPITAERVLETVSWLAADERAGRDTGSPELIAAGEWIAARFAAAGLQQLRPDSWYHEFPLPGQVLDSREVRLKLVRKVGDEQQEFVLAGDTEARQWTAGDALRGDGEPATVALLDDPVLQRMLQAESARRLVVCEVAEDHPFWLKAAGSRSVLGGRRQAARPLLLVKKGLLPAAPDDRREATWTATWSVGQPAKTEVAQRNVVGLLRGGAKREEHVVVSAHYDHVGVGAPVGGDHIYNGADDDATGTTAVLLLAEAMSKQPPPQRSVLFVCFTGEEKGLLGSAAFCRQPPVPIASIVANLNIEMIGRPEPGKEGMAWITGAELSDFAAIVEPALRRGGIALTDFRMASQLFAASDNYSFVRQGIVAHSLSAGSLHADYHKPSDSVDKLDIPHMTKVIGGLLQAATELADRAEPPQWNDKGRERLQRLKR